MKIDVRPLEWTSFQAHEFLNRANEEGIPAKELDKLVKQGAVDRRQS